MYSNPFNGPTPCMRLGEIYRRDYQNLMIIARYNNEMFAHSPLFPELMIGNKGTIYNMAREMVMNHNLDSHGYHHVTVLTFDENGVPFRRCFSVARLVMIAHAFRPDYLGLQVNHKNKNIDCNYYHPTDPNSNLEWTTSLENNHHKFKYGHSDDEYHINTYDDMNSMAKLLSEGKDNNEIAKIMNRPVEEIRRATFLIRNRNTWGGVVFGDMYPNIPYPIRRKEYTEEHIITICDLLERGKYVHEIQAVMMDRYGLEVTKSDIMRLKRKVFIKWSYITDRYKFHLRSDGKISEKDVIQLCEYIKKGYTANQIYKMDILSINMTFEGLSSLITALRHNRREKWRYITTQYFPEG